MTEPLPNFANLPTGRMLILLKLETGLRLGQTYEAMAKRLGISLSASKHWASEFGFRQCDLNLETAEMRAARHVRWALALSDLGREEEAGAFEAEARRLEGLLSRLEKRAAKDPERPDPLAPARTFIEKVRASLGPEADAGEAFAALSAYYRALRGFGAILKPDGQVRWRKEIAPGGLPKTPDWLPCNPWEVTDQERWGAEVGRALAIL
ncbi:hypothetical protein [Henriciella marina]|uniref:hypothetical protein n=1 Tax=Henriciella marina TaxID=453851 RepID=UPI00036BE812|nr:hypothetical protein [Henriciella marina]